MPSGTAASGAAQTSSAAEAAGEAEVLVVGGGPGGAAAAYHLARAGVDVLVLEKSSYPREKVCGDGLTPRSVRALNRVGVDTSERAGWLHNRGLRVIGGGRRLEIPWPDLASFPDYGLTRPRADLDELLIRQAQRAGARLQQRTTVTEPLFDRTGRVIGVRAQVGPDKAPATFTAPYVIAADGVSGRLPIALGLQRRPDRPMGVAVRQYFTTPRHADDFLESWLELYAGDRLLPGYGWIFGLGDGTANVGLGSLNSSPAFRHTDYRRLLGEWLATLPAEWGFAPGNETGPVRGGGLPMGFNRTPHYTRGLLLVGDAGGVVNPFNGEGIAYAMESGELAADAVVSARSRTVPAARERVLASYPAALRAAYGGYYRLGGVFVELIGHPQVMRFCTRHGLPRPTLMRFVLKLLANLTDPHDGDAADRVINALTKLAPAV